MALTVRQEQTSMLAIEVKIFAISFGCEHLILSRQRLVLDNHLAVYIKGGQKLWWCLWREQRTESENGFSYRGLTDPEDKFNIGTLIYVGAKLITVSVGHKGSSAVLLGREI